jgi:hypothetical protein
MTEIQPKSKRRTPSRKSLPSAQGLGEEIAMLRSVFRKVEAFADEAPDIMVLIRMLDTLGKTATRLGTALRTERLLDEGQDMAGTIHQALTEVLEEMRNPPGARP